MKKLSFDNKDGFSLVETLVAITILLIVITGPLSIGTTTARSTSFSSEQVVAFFLAQEGTELAQKARDDILLDYHNNPVTTPAPWTKFKDTASAASYRLCFVSYNTDGCALELVATDATGALKTPVDCSDDNATYSKCKLYYKDTGERDRYTYNKTGTVEETKYTRVIKMEAIGSDQVKVVSTVTWRTGSQRAQQQVVAETYLFNVYGNN